MASIHRSNTCLRSLRVAALIACAASSACVAEGEGDGAASNTPVPAGEEVALRPWSEALARDTLLTPQQGDSLTIVRVSGTDWASDGSFLVADVSEARVSWFRADGSLIRRFGRKGQGPGEFQTPRFARFGADSLIHVADVTSRRVQVFDRSGQLRRATTLEKAGTISGFSVLGRNDYLVAGRSSTPDVLFRIDTLGDVTQSYLPIRDLLPRGASEHPIWESTKAFLLTVRNDTAFVVSTLSDTLWTVALSSGAISRIPFAFEGYAHPRAPGPDDEAGIRGIRAWSAKYHLPASIFTTGSAVYVPVVKGVLNFGDPLVVLRFANGRWQALDSLPPTIAASPRGIVALEDPDADTVRLRFFRERR